MQRGLVEQNEHRMPGSTFPRSSLHGHPLNRSFILFCPSQIDMDIWMAGDERAALLTFKAD